MEKEFTAEEVKAAMADARFEGEPVRLGKNVYIVPSLSIKQAKKLWPLMMEMDAKGITKETIPEQQDACVAIIHAALTRNYPNLGREELDDLIDMSNIRTLMLIVSAQSGFKERALGETKPAAERPVVN